jgi:hypothetical protein
MSERFAGSKATRWILPVDTVKGAATIGRPAGRRNIGTDAGTGQGRPSAHAPIPRHWFFGIEAWLIVRGAFVGPALIQVSCPAYTVLASDLA